jgi:hypothetical protein
VPSTIIQRLVTYGETYPDPGAWLWKLRACRNGTVSGRRLFQVLDHEGGVRNRRSWRV